MWRSNRIRRIVRVTKMLKRWRKKASSLSSTSVPSDVPPGHVAVVVGRNGRRFIIRATHLNHPVFENLLRKAEDEFGFDNNEGPIYIPCDESAFEDALRIVSKNQSIASYCRANESLSLPLLHSIPEKPLC